VATPVRITSGATVSTITPPTQATRARFVSANTTASNEPIVDFRHDNLTQGVGIGWSSVLATGTPRIPGPHRQAATFVPGRGSPKRRLFTPSSRSIVMTKFTLSLLSLCLAVVGCGRLPEADSAEDADESATVSSAESALTAELSDEVAQPMSTTPEQMAMSSVARIGSRFKPQGCATSTAAGATVTYTLADCTGPYGLVKVSGTLTAVYSRATGGGVNVVITGKGIKANGATLDVNSTVVGTMTNGVKKAVVTVDAGGTGPRGGGLTRKGSYTITFDSMTECVTVDGTWQTGGARTGASTVVSGFKRCTGECPAAGGSIVHTGARDEAVTVTYDGSKAAKFSSTGGRSGTVPLQCGG